MHVTKNRDLQQYVAAEGSITCYLQWVFDIGPKLISVFIVAAMDNIFLFH